LYFTIEIDSKLHRWSKKRFQKYHHIHPIRGDSGAILPSLISAIRGSTLFLLDAHCSWGVTRGSPKLPPIVKELSAIFTREQNCNDIVVIDDARYFGKEPGYPPIAEIKNLITLYGTGHNLSIQNDLIILEIPG
jgi:hypothetical protein